MGRLKIWQLVALLILVVGGTTLFVGLASGWFSDNRAEISAEYLCGDNCDGEYMDLTIEDYDKLVADKKSFVIFVDQSGCTTADRLEGFVADYGKSKGIKVYKIMFEDVKKSSLHDSVKYYPSVVVVKNGNVLKWLKADEDEDSDAYNRYDSFQEWANKYIK